MSEQSNQEQAKQAASETLGRELLQATVDELRNLPDVWAKVSEQKQKEILERLRDRIDHDVGRAVRHIASQGASYVVAKLDEVKFKGGVEAKLKLPENSPHRLELADHQGQHVLVVITDEDEFTAGMDQVQADPDQPELPIGEDGEDEDAVDDEWLPWKGGDQPIHGVAVDVTFRGGGVAIGENPDDFNWTHDEDDHNESEIIFWRESQVSIEDAEHGEYGGDAEPEPEPDAQSIDPGNPPAQGDGEPWQPNNEDGEPDVASVDVCNRDGEVQERVDPENLNWDINGESGDIIWWRESALL